MTNRHKTLEYARRALSSSNCNGARKALRKIENYRSDHEVVYLLAVSYALDKSFDKAESLFSKTLKLAGPSEVLLGNLGLAQLDQGKYKQAIETYLAAVELNPRFYDGLVNLALSYDYLNLEDSAVHFAEKAQKIAQRSPVVLNILAKQKANTGQVEEAIGLYNSSLRLNPQLPQTYDLLSKAYLLARNPKEAEAILKRGLSILPKNVVLETSLARLYSAKNRLDEAAEIFRKMAARDKRNTFAIAALAETLVDAQKFDQARDLLITASDKFPNNPELAAELSYLHQLHKEYESAYQLTASFLQNAPDGSRLPESIAIAHSKACQRLGKLEEAKAIMEESLFKNTPAPDARESLHHALGGILDEMSLYDDAFTSYKNANELIKRESDIDYYEAVIGSLIATVDRAYLDASAKSNSETAKPVFIVGMPRSGTSLVEQVIASHPEVYGAGELNDIFEISYAICGVESMLDYASRLREVSSFELEGYAESYLRTLSDLADGESRVTDKMPHNFIHLGLIERLFPNAAVIHCQRHPFDTCLSNYFMRMNDSHIYARNLSDLARFYKCYMDLMKHWEEVSTLKILNVRYENIVADLQGETAKIINHVGLEWSDSVLDYHNSKRVIMTPSAHQASKPIYTSSQNRWRNYQPYLSPLVEVLGAAENYEA